MFLWLLGAVAAIYGVCVVVMMFSAWVDRRDAKLGRKR